jgi:eukaryotic-like serine/threonine-protein kinase
VTPRNRGAVAPPLTRARARGFDAAVEARAASPEAFGLVGETLAGRFRVDLQVSEGGFGVVYRAHQLALDRRVALKVLKVPGGLAGEARAAFERTFMAEARTIARLRHPHIVEVHDFGVNQRASGGLVLWMALEWLEGETLEAVLADARARHRPPMTPARALALLRPVLQAIAHAHRQGVSHRDLKPANIFLTQDHGATVPKVLDFGIAKLAGGEPGPEAAEAVTSPGFRAFSPAYAAPEQVASGRTGPFTDVHALGLIASEMVTGQRPYGESAPPVLAALAGERPTPGRRGVDVGGWEPVLARALALDPAARQADAGALLQALEAALPRAARGGEPGAAATTLDAPAAAVALARARAAVPVQAPAPAVDVAAAARGGRWPRRRRWLLAGVLGLALAGAGGGLGWRAGRPPAPEGLIRMAVLPFANLTGDPAQEYFTDGLTEGMISQLGRLSPDRLAVIARTSVNQYKGTSKSVRDIARELNVAYLLECSAARSGNRVRIDARLIDARDQTPVWARSYDQEIKDVLALQGEVARAISAEVRLTLTSEQQVGLRGARTLNPAAYDAYLRARNGFEGDADDSYRRATALYEQAIKLDPEFAAAHAGLAQVYSMYQVSDARFDELGPKAKAAALRALELDPDLPEAHVALASNLLKFDWDWAGADKHFRRALELDPNSPDAHRWYGQYQQAAGRLAEAIALRKRAVELAPFSLNTNRVLGQSYYYARRYDEAIRQLQASLALEPGSSPLPVFRFLALAFAQLGRHDEAMAQAVKGGDHPEHLALVGYLHARAGRRPEALAAISRLQQKATAGYVPAILFARVYAGFGKQDQTETLTWLEKAFSERHKDLIFLRVDPHWDAIREDPRFEGLCGRVRIPVPAGE